MDMDKYIGRLLDGRYEILEVIGTGGMAVVYKARCHRLNRLVAVKILKDELTQDEEFRRRFHAESQAVATMSHPNIVSVYDVSTSDEADFIVMELIDGITLKQYMGKKGVLNWKETLHFAIQIGKALDHAHSRGIIHRDIKPHNVMVLKNGSVKVTDFGIAQVMSKSSTLTKEALGSVHYISPEQAKGGRVDNRSDLYSLGVVMYEMMTGRPPFDGDSPVSVAIQHINGNTATPSSLNPNIPGGLEQIIMKAMAKEPSDRYATATAMLYDMDEFRKDPTILFDYNNPSTGMDDAAIIASGAAAAGATIAEKTAAKGGGETPVRKTPPKTATTQRTADRPQKKKRRREEIVEDEERGGKVVTVVVILFALLTLVAIGLFIYTLMGSAGDITDNQNKITLPNLYNKTLEEVSSATDYVVVVDYYSYDENVADGRIISQNPAANTRIEPGSTVTVVVSAGPEPQEKVMRISTGSPLDQAISYLVNTQGIDENQIITIKEFSSEVEENCVIRTDPMIGETIPAGAPITLYVSKGPQAVYKTMADLTSDFYDEESAIKWLTLNGFKDYTVVYVESDLPSGKVISQSVKAGTSVDVKTYIVLQVSAYEEKPQPKPPAPPVEDPEDYVSKQVIIMIPEDVTEDCVLSIYRENVLVEERTIPAGSISTQVNLTGIGVMEFTVELSTGASWTIEVDFNTVSDDTGTTEPDNGEVEP